MKKESQIWLNSANSKQVFPFDEWPKEVSTIFKIQKCLVDLITYWFGIYGRIIVLVPVLVVLFGTGMRRMVFSRWNHFCISILNFLIWIIMHLAFIGLDLLKKDSHNHSQIYVGLGLMVAFFISVGLYLSIPTQIVWIYYRMNRISDYNIMIGLKKEKRNNRSRTTLAVRERLRAESAAN